MGNTVYLNGEIIPIEDAKISVTDRGFLYGDALVETLRTYRRAPFMLQSHLSRLLDSAKELDFDLTLSIDQIKEGVYKLVENNDIEDAVIRITLTRGNSMKRSLFENLTQPNLLITLSSLQIDNIVKTQAGAKAITGVDKRGSFSNYKNSSMFASVMTYKKALEKGAFDMILISKRGFVTEGTRCNVFMVLDNILFTPPADKMVLSGITRKVVINIARKNNIRVEEDAVVGQDLANAQEIFLTNSLFEVVPVTTLDGRPVANGQKGLITSQIQKGYRALVNNWLGQVGLTVMQ